MQNGQQATITISDNLNNQVQGVQFAQLPNGNYVLQPIFGPIPINTTTMTIQAVISADRRFVRLTPNLTLQNTSASNPQPQQPILVPIYPVPPGTGLSEGPAIYSQFVTQPRTSSITINTTVMVPDGGTVVMGGLKRLSEGRNEYGPPILSQLPYIDRLFRNTAYGRSGSSILIMVTPRIIIQEEEEERATNFRVQERAVP